MSTLQVRNVPDDLRQELKSRAALAGKSLSDYLLDELRVAATRPTMAQWLDATARLEPPSRRPTPAADVLAVERAR